MKKLILLFFTLIITFLVQLPLLAMEQFTVPAKQAIAIEVDTGKILYAQNEQEKVPIASLTKLVTAYLVYEAIEKGELSMDSFVPISDYPYQLTVSGVSNVYLEARNYQVKDLLHASLISSANSATIALAEKIAGSEPAFVDRMQKKLNDWGITGAKLVNATGLSNQFLGENRYPGSAETDENQLSASDIAIIARRLLLDFPQILEVTSRYSYTFEGNTYLSADQMIEGGTHARAGVDGLKTSFGDTSGASYVSTMQGKKMRILTVVLNVENGLETPDNRFVATNHLMDFVINRFTTKVLLEKKAPLPKTSIPIFNGEKAEITPVVPRTIKAVVENGKEDQITSRFVPSEKDFTAPIKKGQEVGLLHIVDSNLVAKGYISEQPSVAVIAPDTVPAASWPFSWWNHFVRYVNEKL